MYWLGLSFPLFSILKAIFGSLYHSESFPLFRNRFLCRPVYTAGANSFCSLFIPFDHQEMDHSLPPLRTTYECHRPPMLPRYQASNEFAKIFMSFNFFVDKPSSSQRVTVPIRVSPHKSDDQIVRIGTRT